jgi:hypothetical protein
VSKGKFLHLIRNRYSRYLWLSMRKDERFFERERRYSRRHAPLLATMLRSIDSLWEAIHR